MEPETGCQKADGNQPPKLGKWAIITMHPSLPSADEQIARARAWGIAESMLSGSDVSALVIDDVRKQKSTTKWAGKLPKREAFLHRASHPDAAMSGSIIFFATSLCVGFGRAHALETMRAIWAAGMHVYVHSMGAQYAAEGDMTDFFDQHAHEANVAYVKAYRARERKSKGKRTAPLGATARDGG